MLRKANHQKVMSKRGQIMGLTRAITVAAATMSALQVAGSASASIFDYSYTSDGANSPTFSFSVDDADAVPGGAGGGAFSFPDVAVTDASGTNSVEVDFFYAASRGGLSIGYQLYGPQLFLGSAGTTQDPTVPELLTGSFILDNADGNRIGLLKVSEEASGDVPEPASWALMIGGFGLVGSALRRTRQTISFAA